LLDEQGRREELARIIGGEITDTTLQAAQEMRARAEE
jgi:DNA repair ATPase RecN